MLLYIDLPRCRQERMMSKRMKLKVSKTSEDSGVLPAVSTLGHIKKKLNDSISSMNIDMPDTPGTPSPLNETLSTLGTATTIESGIVTSPRSLDEITEHYENLERDRDHYFDRHGAKLKVERTQSDTLNHNNLDYDTELSPSIPYHDNIT